MGKYGAWTYCNCHDSNDSTVPSVSCANALFVSAKLIGKDTVNVCATNIRFSFRKSESLYLVHGEFFDAFQSHVYTMSRVDLGNHVHTTNYARKAHHLRRMTKVPVCMTDSLCHICHGLPLAPQWILSYLAAMEIILRDMDGKYGYCKRLRAGRFQKGVLSKLVLSPTELQDRSSKPSSFCFPRTPSTPPATRIYGSRNELGFVSWRLVIARNSIHG
jgi:hypothetical protein